MKKSICSLYDVFENCLFRSDYDEEDSNSFISRVVDTYWESLQHEGFVLEQYVREVRDELEEEVLEMFRKKTYGYFSLQEYRKALGLRSKDH